MKAIKLLSVFIWFVPAVVTAADPPAPALSNKLCPVKTGEAVVADQFVEYQGKRVLFCCEKCKTKFAKDPTLYLANLPQFADAAKSVAKHWAYQPITRPAVPAIRNPHSAIHNPIDAFILAKLAQEKLAPSPECDRVTLIRRLTYDLQGLPPTPEEVDAFVNDKSAGAYEKLVDHLLASPRYGERWGRHWLDIVHFGESHGYDKDKKRPNSWPYRDYVIRSLNADKPYARFVEEQLAGDVLFPDDTDGVIALGFIAAGPWDYVGHVELSESKTDGLIARYNDRDDMVSSTMQTFVSTTANCARCHNHKFDPIPQTDYYRLQAVFAGIDRADRAYESNPETARHRAALKKQRDELAARKTVLDAKIQALAGPDLATIDKQIGELSKIPTTGERPEFGYHSAIVGSPNVAKWVQVDLGEPVAIDQVIIVGCHDDFNNIGAGFGFPPRFKIEAANDADFKQDVATITDQTAKDYPNPLCKPQSFAARGTKARYVRVTATALALRQNDYIFALAELLLMTADGKNLALGKAVSALDSIEAPVRWGVKNLTDGYYFGVTNAKATADLAQLNRQRQELLDRVLTAEIRGERDGVEQSLKKVSDELAALPPPGFVYAANPQFETQGGFVSTGGKPRPIYLLKRGNVKDPKELMTPGALSLLPDLERYFTLTDANIEGARRAALAKWITDRDNPLTWRTIVNRVWQYHFGRGLVDTPNDFGKMGSPPTHPELLDWLATEFRDNGGSLKKLHKLILMSATYRQSSRSSPQFAALDADNRFLWRANRQRLDAEAIHDAALSISGKLDLTMGGRSVEQFYFKDDHSPVYDYTRYDVDSAGANRRAVYRHIVRSVPDPFMASMDCADPNVFTPKRNTTLTALQALALLNDRFILRQTEHFAERVKAMKPDVPGQIETAYWLALARAPKASESKLLVGYAEKYGLVNACRLILNSNEFVFVD